MIISLTSCLCVCSASANGHCTASQYSAIPRELLTRTNQKFNHNFSVFEGMKIAQDYAEVSLPSPHSFLYSTPKCYFFRWKALFH